MLDLKSELTSKQFLLALSIMALFFTMPIILSGNYYVDDIIRSNTGMLGWWGLGRPASDFIISLVSFNFNGSSDVYPVTILLACSANIFTSYTLCKIFSLKYSLSSAIICSLPTVSPLYIQNMMYRYDCLPMSLAIMLAVYAHYVIFNKNYSFILISSMMLIFSFMLYQPATPTFVVLSIFTYINSKQLEKDSSLITKSALSFAISIASYSLYTKLAVNTTRSKLVFERKDWFEFMGSNAIKLFDIYERAYSAFGIVVISLLCIYCVMKYTHAIFTNSAVKSVHRFLRLVMLPFPVYALIASSILIAIIAEWPAGPRVAIPFTFFLFGIILTTYRYTKFKAVFIVLPAAFVAHAIVTSAAVSNAYNSQIKMDYNTALLLANDLDKKDISRGKLFISGRTKPTDLSLNNEKAFPIIKDINFPANHWVMSLILREYGLKNVVIDGSVQLKEHLAQSACAKNTMLERSRYNICYLNDNTYVLLK